MNLRKFFKLLLGDTSRYFTLLAVLYSIAMLLVNVGKQEVLLRASTLFFLFLFALLAALARSLLRLSSMSGAARLLLHYLGLTFAFFLCLLLPNGMRATQVLIGLVLFSIVYWIGAGLVHVFYARFQKQSEQSEAYEKQFSKKR